jgi:hypothetical protein
MPFVQYEVITTTSLHQRDDVDMTPHNIGDRKANLCPPFRLITHRQVNPITLRFQSLLFTFPKENETDPKPLSKMSSNDKLREIAEKAEHDLNTYQAKTGRARGHDLEDASGVDSRAPKKFPGADLRYGDDLITNASYDRPIPPEEGGVVDKMHQ